MARRLSNDELAENVRSRVRRNCAIYRDRLSRSGRRQTLVWLPEAIRAQLDGLAESRQQSLSAVTADLLSAALTPAIPAPPSSPVDTLPLFDAPQTPVDRDSRILALKREQPQLSNYAIAAQIGCSEATARRVVHRAKQEAAP